MNIKNTLKYAIPAILVGLFVAGGVYAQSILTGKQGGTGFGSTGAGNIGKCLGVLSVSPLTYTFSDCVGGSGSVANGIPGFVTRYTGTSTITTGVSLDNGTVAGVNATSSTVSFNVQGTGILNPFRVASSTGTALLTVAVNGTTTIASLGTGLVRSSSGSLYTDTATYLTSALTSINGATGPAISLATGTAGNIFHIASSSNTFTINIPVATASITGQLSSTDWSTFNNKVSNTYASSTFVTNVTGSGNIASSGGLTPNITFTGTLPIANGGTNQTSYTTNGVVFYDGTQLNSEADIEWNGSSLSLSAGSPSFTALLDVNGSFRINGEFLINASAGNSGELLVSQGAGSAPIWNSLAGLNIVTNTRNINTTAPLSGGGDLSADRTLSITQSGSGTDGYLSSTDWNTFNDKVGLAYASSSYATFWNVREGSNITITTSTPGVMTISSSGGGTNYFTLNGTTLYNNTGDRLGIGSSTPTATLAVQGSSTAPTLDVLRVASSSGTTFLNVTSGGNVGIGTTTPGVALYVVGAITNTGLITSTQGLSVGSATYNTRVAVNASTFGSPAISYLTDSNTGLHFGTALGSADTLDLVTAGVSRLFVGSTGNVGIGTSTPLNLLTVQGSATSPTQTLLTVASSTGSNLFIVGSNGSTTISSLGTGLVRSSSGGLFIGPIDISADTNLAAGRSLTLTGDSVDADVELYTSIKSISITSASGSISATTTAAQAYFPLAVTITRIVCSTDVGTATIQFDERAEATPNTAGTDVMTGTLACDNSSEATTSFSNAGIASRVPLNLDIDSVASSPTRVRIHIEYTIDD